MLASKGWTARARARRVGRRIAQVGAGTAQREGGMVLVLEARELLRARDARDTNGRSKPETQMVDRRPQMECAVKRGQARGGGGWPSLHFACHTLK